MQESSTENSHSAEQAAPKRSGFSPLLVIIVLIIVAAFYWYLQTPQVATFENKAIATFNTSHNFDAPDLKAFGEGIVVVAPAFKPDADATHTNLGVTIWAKQPGKIVEIKEIEIANLTLPFASIPQLSPSDVQSGLFRIDATLKEGIPTEALIEAARKSGGKLKLTLKANVLEHTPQRQIHPQEMLYAFDVHKRHLMPWSK